MIRLFRKKAISQEIISINQNISLKTREFFSDNEKMLEMIDYYKNEYNQILSRFKYFTSLDINSKDLVDSMNTNIELLLNLSMSNNEVRRYTLNDKIDCLVNIKKLDLYKDAIDRLEIEITARLIALNEIYNERKTFMSHNKMNALKNEIYNLSIAMQLLNNKKIAIELEKSCYTKNAIYIANSINDYDEEIRLLLKKRNMLLNISHVLFPEKNIIIREEKEYIFDDLAKVERLIELYVFTHKNDADSLRKELEIINEKDINVKDKNKVLSLIHELEYKFLAFYKYGRDYIAIEDLMQLYLLKFNYQVLSEDGISDVFVNSESTDIELECYRGIVEREIESFIMGQSEVKNPEIIKTIVNILKNKKKAFDYYEILTNKYLLNVLLSMSSENDLVNLLKHLKVKKSDFSNVDFCDEVFEFEDELPLETVYRIMNAQDICSEALLYQFLERNLYPPDQGYYFLPIGLKGINYFVDSEVEDFVLNESTLKLIKKMRSLMDNNFIVCPTSLDYINNGYRFLHGTPIKNLIFPEGLVLSRLDADSIKVLERGNNRISVYNVRDEEIITSDLESHLGYKWGYFDVACQTNQIPSQNLYIEEYNYYEKNNSQALWKNIMDSRSDFDTLLLSRAYADVTTKYGDFCIHIEERNNSNQNGSQVALSFYHGHHDEIIDKSTEEFNWPEYGIFRTKYMEKNDFYQWMLGFVDSVWSHPFRNIWTYKQTKNGKDSSDSPIYSFSEFQGNGKRGTIFIDGSLKLEDNEQCIPDMFENLEVDEYESIPYNSKAYFGTPSEHVAILKDLNSNNIRIIYKQRNRKTGQFEEKASTNVTSFSNHKFIGSDFEKIIIALYKMPISGHLKNFIIDEIRSYKTLHHESNPISIGTFPNSNYIELKNTLKVDGYDLLLSILERNNPNELVEKLIENIMKVFKISLDDLLGKALKDKENIKEKVKIKKNES